MEITDTKKSPKKNQKGSSDFFCKIIAVQFIACAFLIVLLSLVCKLSPDGFNNIKTKYDGIMAKDLSVSEIWSSVKEVASYVMKPVDINSVQETNVNTAENFEDEDKEEPTTQNTEEEKTEEPKKEEDNKEVGKVAAVMSLFSDDSDISVPIKGRITSRFGYRTDPISGENALHSGIDIATAEGTSVRAAWDGIVTETGKDEKKGNYVWMVHKNGNETLYCHCSKILVEKGAVIRAGEAIALSGSTGYSTGPHLHFCIRENGKMVDPLNYLSENDGRI